MKKINIILITLAILGASFAYAADDSSGCPYQEGINHAKVDKDGLLHVVGKNGILFYFSGEGTYYLETLFFLGANEGDEYNPKTKVHAVTMNCVYTTEGSSMGPPHLVTLTGKLNNFDQFKVDPPMWKLNKDNNRYECFAPDNSAMYDGTRGGDNCPFMVVDPLKPRTVPSRIETH